MRLRTRTVELVADVDGRPRRRTVKDKPRCQGAVNQEYSIGISHESSGRAYFAARRRPEHLDGNRSCGSAGRSHVRNVSRHLDMFSCLYLCNFWEAYLNSVVASCRVSLPLRYRFRDIAGPGLQQPKSVRSRSTFWSSRRQRRCLILRLRAPLGASPH